jgi:hypothetical protein
MNIDMSVIEEAKSLAENKLPAWLLSNTVDFSTAAFILQAVLDKIDEVEKELKI